MSEPLGFVLDQRSRERLAAFADELMPAGEGLPSGSAAQVHGKWIDRTLAVRPDLIPVLVAALSLDGDATTALSDLRRENPSLFEGLAFTLCGAYLMNPKVRRLLGYPGPAPRPSPAFLDEADFYLEGGLLDAVVARGPIYRAVPAPDPLASA